MEDLKGKLALAQTELENAVKAFRDVFISEVEASPKQILLLAWSVNTALIESRAIEATMKRMTSIASQRDG